ncbi:MAG: hypothetical protein K4305_04860 [Chlorobium sp.]|uniref:baeRF3 domain-containing protein n=1 Tax=Chlorobium sp. TaxID=1095 RepID=UPI002F404BC7
MISTLSDYSGLIVAPHEPPCLSIYQKTHRRHPDNLQDPIRFRNLVKKLEEILEKNYPGKVTNHLLEPFFRLAGDHRFWNHALDGLAVFGSPGMFRIYWLQEEVQDEAMVADSFYTKPLLRIFQSYARYQILALSRDKVRLYTGTKHALDRVDLAGSVPQTLVEALGEEITPPHQTVASYGGTKGNAMHHGHGSKKDEEEIDTLRFFRMVDKTVQEHHSQRSQLPLILAALPENQGRFRRISQNTLLLEEGIVTNPDSIQENAFHEQAWAIIEPQLQQRLHEMLEEYSEALPKGIGSDDLEKTAAAAAAGRVSVLFINNDVRIAGHLDRQTGVITVGMPELTGESDLLDDLGELVLRNGGKVVVLPSEKMPAEAGFAATFRY